MKPTLADKLTHIGVVACELAFVGMVLTLAGYIIVTLAINFGVQIGWALVSIFAVLAFCLVFGVGKAAGKPVDHFRDFRGEP